MNEEHGGETRKARRVGRKVFLILALLVGVVIAGVLLEAWLEREPVYKGQALSQWLTSGTNPVNFTAFRAKNPEQFASRDAVRHIGTNAIPFLLRMLKAKDPAWKMKVVELCERWDLSWSDRIEPSMSADREREKGIVGFFYLDDLASNAVPALIDICKNRSWALSGASAEYVLKGLYPAPGTTIPYWVPENERVGWYCDAGEMKATSGAQTNAILAFTEAIKLDSTNASAYLGRASAKLEMKDFGGALADANRLIQISTNNLAAFNIRAGCEFSLKDFKGAEADFTKVIAANTNDFYAYSGRGITRANLRKLDDALADFDEAVRLAPTEAEPFRSRAAVELLQKEYEQALEDVSESIRLNDREAGAYVLRGRIKSALKDYPGALEDLNRAIELNPKDASALAVRGAVRVYMDDFERAEADLEKSLELNPKGGTAYLVRGMLKVKRGDGEEGALADLERGTALSTSEPGAYAILGLVQYRYSRRDTALINCRKALEGEFTRNAGDARSYIWLIRAQKGEEAEASRELADYLGSLKEAKTNEWDAGVARFLSGGLTESNFLVQATTKAKRPSAVRGQVCESLYYAGMKRKLAGDKQGAAELFRKCVETKDDNNFGYMNAVAELRSLKKD